MGNYVITDENKNVVAGPLLWDGETPLEIEEGKQILPVETEGLVWPIQESTDTTIEDAKAAIESATTIAALRKAVVEALDILEQSI